MNTMTTPTLKRDPWSWIPTLYFAEGLPYVAVMTIAVIMYKRLGLSNTGNSSLHLLALPAVDYQALMEPVR